MIELRHLEVFVTVAAEKHIGRAARRLGLAQPRVSTLLQRLEELVDTRLIERRPRIELTPAGLAFLSHAQASLQAAEVGHEAVQRHLAGLGGRLRLGFPTWVLGTPILSAVAVYRATHPDITIDLLDLSTEEQFRRIREGRLSAGFVRAGASTSGGVIVAPLFEEDWVLALPKGHRLSAMASVGLDELRGERLVGFPRDLAPPIHDEINGLFVSAGLTMIVEQEAQEWLSIVGLVTVGAGVAVVPACVGGIWSREVCYRPLKGARARSVVSICISAAADPTTRRFAEQLRLSMPNRDAAH